VGVGGVTTFYLLHACLKYDAILLFKQINALGS